MDEQKLNDEVVSHKVMIEEMDKRLIKSIEFNSETARLLNIHVIEDEKTHGFINKKVSYILGGFFVLTSLITVIGIFLIQVLNDDKATLPAEKQGITIVLEKGSDLERAITESIKK